ncbi:MAG: ion transporter [Thermaurantiacus sp.]
MSINDVFTGNLLEGCPLFTISAAPGFPLLPNPTEIAAPIGCVHGRLVAPAAPAPYFAAGFPRGKDRHSMQAGEAALGSEADRSVRARVAALVHSDRFQNAIIAVIIVNAVVLGLETSDWMMANVGGLLITLDRIALAIFVVEIGLKLYADRVSFFRSGWNVFDFAIVSIALLPASEGLAVLRALRILRAMRLVSALPSLRRVVEGLLRAIPAMGSVVLLLTLVFYVGAVMATKLFGAAFPDWFGSVGASLYSLFQIMTLESWSMGIVRPVMEVYPFAWAFFVPFILVTSFMVLNLFIAIIVTAMTENDAPPAPATPIKELTAEMAALRREIASLRTEQAASRTPAE